MSTPTKQELLDRDPNIVDPIELNHFAANAAALWLADNWAQALKDGDAIETLLHDVDEVCRILQEWRAAVAAKLGS